MSNIFYNLYSIYERMWDFMSSNDYVLTDSTQAGIEASKLIDTSVFEIYQGHLLMIKVNLSLNH